MNYGIIAYRSMTEACERSSSNFATLSYLQGPNTSTGYAGDDLETSIIVGDIADSARFSLNQPGCVDSGCRYCNYRNIRTDNMEEKK